jgi:hypothetical protein
VGAALLIIDWFFGDIALLITYDWPVAYQNVVLLVGVFVLFEYCTDGARRIFFPTLSERLMDYDRGKISVSRIPLPELIL